MASFILEIISILVVSFILCQIVKGPPSEWRFSDIPSQNGKVVLITGANSGIGFQSARYLALNNASVIMSCRDIQRCNEAADKIKSEFPHSKITTLHLDLSKLSSVNNFVRLVKENFSRLDILINNAGIICSNLTKSEDNLDIHMATNHFGPFSLTIQLLPLMISTSKIPNPETGKFESPRIITVTSLVERLNFFHDYLPIYGFDWEIDSRDCLSIYVGTKVANVHFIMELNRRLSQNGHKILPIIAQPGICTTEIFSKVRDPTDRERGLFLSRWFGQSPEMGAASILYAATKSGVKGSEYIEPDDAFGVSGWPKPKRQNLLYEGRKGRDLWEVSEIFTGQKFP